MFVSGGLGSIQRSTALEVAINHCFGGADLFKSHQFFFTTMTTAFSTAEGRFHPTTSIDPKTEGDTKNFIRQS
jgi:hypothetical protein